MNKLIKRLQVIKSFILLEEFDDIDFQIKKINSNKISKIEVLDNAILKNKVDPAEFQKRCYNLKFPSGNQSNEDNADISKSDADKHAIL